MRGIGQKRSNHLNLHNPRIETKPPPNRKSAPPLPSRPAPRRARSPPPPPPPPQVRNRVLGNILPNCKWPIRPHEHSLICLVLDTKSVTHSSKTLWSTYADHETLLPRATDLCATGIKVDYGTRALQLPPTAAKVNIDVQALSELRRESQLISRQVSLVNAVSSI